MIPFFFSTMNLNQKKKFWFYSHQLNTRISFNVWRFGKPQKNPKEKGKYTEALQ